MPFEGDNRVVSAVVGSTASPKRDSTVKRETRSVSYGPMKAIHEVGAVQLCRPHERLPLT